MTGSTELHRRLVTRLAALKGQEAAPVLPAGWQANAAVRPALLRVGPAPVTVFADRLIHASPHHGIAAAGLRQRRYRTRQEGQRVAAADFALAATVTASCPDPLSSGVPAAGSAAARGPTAPVRR